MGKTQIEGNQLGMDKDELSYDYLNESAFRISNSAYNMPIPNLTKNGNNKLKVERQSNLNKLNSMQSNINHLPSSSSFKIDDILSSSSSLLPANNKKLSTLNLNDLKQGKNQIEIENYYSNMMKNTDKYSTNSSASSSSSSSSYCSPISSASSASYQNPINIENLIGIQASMPNPNEFLLNQVNNFTLSSFVNNPYMANYQKLFENSQSSALSTNYAAIMEQLALQHQNKLQFQQQNQNNYAFDLLKSFNNKELASPSAQTANKQVSVECEDNGSNEDETKQKLNMINELAKKIDAFSEVSTKVKDKSGSSKIKKKLKNKLKNKKRERDSGDECGCSDLACSLSSMLPIDQRNLPMCLRGASEEQLHLASLFNTLIHHKKCRRTRTVFTDMQLIGLEKRFENQKYLSTPDRIQLAETLGLSQLQVKTWYQNRRMKWKKKVLKDGCQDPPTKPKGRPKKNSIPSFSEIIAAAEAAENNKSTGSSSASILSSSGIKNSNESLDSIEDDEQFSSDDEDDEDMDDQDMSDDDEDEDDNNEGYNTDSDSDQESFNKNSSNNNLSTAS